ncbi:NAD(P)/FAD-dependent oxidoreductase [Marinomonas sp. MED121]|uniref:NAD(P)/FAD-dependent oxidoreductase n=1 Tax=Marinomonas sp. MED121 TaxID=314277 RepID=UPI0002EDAEE4|nr:NAD(P)/FAD-dependent oxidoreductase [Marinomonas sp. MED121]
MKKIDVLIIGAGASGLMCAANAAYRGRSVTLIDHANMAGKKIIMSGGGRCNFTNMDASPKHFLSQNPHFVISALKRYGPSHFVELMDRHGLEYVEKAPGQLFCQKSAKDLLSILLTECEWAGVNLSLNTKVVKVTDLGESKEVETSQGTFICESLVIATGGLSIPSKGATGFGYQIAEQFGLEVLPTRAGLVPITLQPDLKAKFEPLAGVSCDVSVTANKTRFTEPMLFTHRGLSGPAILQISNHWLPGDELKIDLYPAESIYSLLVEAREKNPKSQIDKVLSQLLPKRLASMLIEDHKWQGVLAEYANQTFEEIADILHNWVIKPNGTEGYRTAEVTLGGVDTNYVSSKTFEAKDVKGLFFIGEVLDVTGWLGGYNFQWAWASGYCAAQYV